MKVLNRAGLEKISNLQDKYKFRNTFEIVEPDEVLDFLRAIKEAEYLGLNLDQADIEMIEEMYEVLTS